MPNIIDSKDVAGGGLTASDISKQTGLPADLVNHIIRECAKYNVPLNIAMGVIGTESSFGRNLGPSSAGALGLMQIMPANESAWIKQIGIAKSDLRNDHKYNATIGIWHLSNLIRNHGNWEKALIIYNIGSGNYAQGKYIDRGKAYAQKVFAKGAAFGKGSPSPHADYGVMPSIGGSGWGIPEYNSADILFGENPNFATIGAMSGMFSNIPQDYVDGMSVIQAYISKRPIVQANTKDSLPFSGVVSGVAPQHDDDIFPGHRKLSYNRRDYLRIGDSMFVIPPEYINVTAESQSSEIHVLRQKEPMRLKGGKLLQQVTFSLYFNGVNQINGYEINAPSGAIGGKYYMDGLRPLIAQLKRMPFLPVQNEYLNYIHDIWAIVVNNVTVETVPGFPHLLRATITAFEFNAEAYLGVHTALWDKMIMYPVFRWWYQRLMRQRDSGIFESHTFLEPMRNTFAASSNWELAVVHEDFLKSDFGSGAGVGASDQMPYVGSKIDMYQKVDVPQSLTITSCAAVLSNITVPLHMDGAGKPAFQFLGGVGTKFFVTMETTNAVDVEFMKSLQYRLEEYTRKYGQKMVSGYLAVNHQFINFFGTQYTMIDSVEVETIGPNHYRVMVSLSSYNAEQRSSEKLHGYSSLGELSQTKIEDPNFLMTQLGGFLPGQYDNLIVQEMMAEHFMNSLELYPDLELPTYDDVGVVIDCINAQRKQFGLTPLPIDGKGFVALKPVVAGKKRLVLVDPDFFMAYRDVSTFEEAQTLSDKTIKDTMKNIFDKNFVALTDGTRATATEQTKITDADIRWATIKNIAMDVKNFRKPMQYWGNEANENYVIGQPQGTSLIGMMCHDMFRYGKKGRLVRAFPSYLMMIIDEGQWIDARRMWNNYYGYHAAIELQIVQDRKSPVHTAYLRLSNVYNTLDHKDQAYRSSPDENRYGWWDTIMANWFIGVDKEKLKQRTVVAETAKIRAGCRVHIRMGYGSVASEMPILFNGTIMDINVGPEIEIVASSDGVELTSIIPTADIDSKTRVWEESNEPQEIIRHFLTERNSALWFAYFGHKEDGDWVGAGTDGMLSVYGLEHFGYVAMKEAGSFTAWVKEVFGDLVTDYDVMKNIYSGTPVGSTLSLRRQATDRRAEFINPDSGTTAYKDHNSFWKGWEKLERFGRSIMTFDGKNDSDGVEVIQIWLYGKSPWDVFKVMAYVSPNYIIYPHYHNLHSTVFFGVPHWLCVTGWTTENPEDLTNKAAYQEIVKPFSQFHVVDSLTDIMSNDITATSRDMYTIAIPQYAYDDEADTTDAIYADPNIKMTLQKTVIVDSTIVQDSMMDWAVSLYANVFGTTDNPGERQSKKFAAAALADSFRDMYDGELLIIGNPAIKPYDKIYLNDFYIQMMGIAEVGRVVHMLSFDTGFVTSIKPDLPTSVIMSENPHYMDCANQIGQLIGDLVPVGAAGAYAGIRAYMYSQTVGMKLAEQGAKAGIMRTVWATVGGIARNLAIVRQAGLLVSASIPGFGWLTGLLTLAVWGALNFVKNQVYKWLTPKQGVLRIYPLIYRDQPFVSGIDGQRTLIPNYYYDTGANATSLSGNAPGASGGGEGQAASFSPDMVGSKWVTPVQGTIRITDTIRYRNSGEIGGGKWHVGIDVAAAKGTPVVACMDGEVVAHHYQANGYGNYVVIRHSGKDGSVWYSIYAHLHDFTTKRGKINAGEYIGTVGSTGLSSGPHLHFEVLKAKGTAVSSPAAVHTKGNTQNLNDYYRYADVYNPVALIKNG